MWRNTADTDKLQYQDAARLLKAAYTELMKSYVPPPLENKLAGHELQHATHGPSKPFFPRPILPNFSVLARACLWFFGRSNVAC